MTDDVPTRIPCLVEGCGRGIGIAAWRKRFGDLDPVSAEYVCQWHWSRVPLRMRAVHVRVRRRERRIGEQLPASSRIWRRLVREVYKRAHDQTAL